MPGTGAIPDPRCHGAPGCCLSGLGFSSAPRLELPLPKALTRQGLPEGWEQPEIRMVFTHSKRPAVAAGGSSGKT